MIDDDRSPAEIARALDAARDTLRDPFTIDHFIVAEAARGPWKGLHQRLTTTPDAPDGTTAGDYINLYAGPAPLIGATLAYGPPSTPSWPMSPANGSMPSSAGASTASAATSGI